MDYIVFFVVIVLLWKWVLLVLFSPLIRYNQKRLFYKYRVSLNIQSESKKSKILDQKNKSIVKMFCVQCLKFINGFTRFIDIEVSRIPSFLVRDFLYKHVFMIDMSEDVVLHYGCEIRDHSKLCLGQGAIIGDNSLLDARNGIKIGKYVNLSSNVSIYTHQHDHRRSDFGCSTNANSIVIIEDRVWIGPNVIILPGVKIGEGAVIGAGAVVNKNIESFSINVGIPAKKIGERSKDLLYQFKGNNKYFI